jgi:glycine/D-amino acid oxidase-like deaminating enzyme
LPGPIPDDVESSTTLPASADAVIIGGGIIGTSTALELTERGLSVVLCEKGIIAGEQSSRNWGWVRLSRRDPREIDLMAASIRLWERLAERIGSDVGYRQCGIVVPFYSDRFRFENEAWLEHIRGTQHRVGTISSDQVRELVPDMHLDYNGALYSPSDGRAEPQKAAPAIARAARAKGATILTGCAVRQIETSGGAVSGVVTERGRIGARTVIVAGGAWSRLILRDIGITLPQLKVLNSVLRTEPVPDGPQVTVRGPGFSVRRREDGGYTVSTLASNVFDLTPDSFRFPPPLYSRAKVGVVQSASAARATVPARVAGRAPHRPGPSLALRADSRARPRAECENDRCRDGSADRGFPGLPGRQGRATLGRAHRRHTGCGPGNLARNQSFGPHHRYRIFRPWFRLGSGRWPAGGRSRDRLETRRRPRRVSLLALLRWIENRSIDGSLASTSCRAIRLG